MSSSNHPTASSKTISIPSQTYTIGKGSGIQMTSTGIKMGSAGYVSSGAGTFMSGAGFSTGTIAGWAFPGTALKGKNVPAHKDVIVSGTEATVGLSDKELQALAFAVAQPSNIDLRVSEVFKGSHLALELWRDNRENVASNANRLLKDVEEDPLMEGIAFGMIDDPLIRDYLSRPELQTALTIVGTDTYRIIRP